MSTRIVSAERLILVVAALSLVGCVVSRPQQSNTPRIRSDSGSTLSASLLLSVDDVREVTALDDVSSSSLDETALFENPDQRGPCGGAVPAGSLRGVIGRSFQGDGWTVVEMLRPSTVTTQSELAAMLADVRQPCGPYESTMHTGATQRVADIVVHDMADVCGRCLVLSEWVTVGTNKSGLTAAIIEHDDLSVLFQSVGRYQLPTAELRELIRRGLARISGQPDH